MLGLSMGTRFHGPIDMSFWTIPHWTQSDTKITYAPRSDFSVRRIRIWFGLAVADPMSPSHESVPCDAIRALSGDGIETSRDAPDRTTCLSPGNDLTVDSIGHYTRQGVDLDPRAH